MKVHKKKWKQQNHKTSSSSFINKGSYIAKFKGENSSLVNLYGKKKLTYMVVKDYDVLSQKIFEAANLLISEKPDALLLVPGCNTPIGFYHELATQVNRKIVDISQVKFITVDSPICLKMVDSRNFKMYMHKHFYQYIYGEIPENADKEKYLMQFYKKYPNFIVPYVPKATNDREAAEIAEEFGKKVKNLGYADLAFLGIGKAHRLDDDKLIGGHIAFNEPGSSIDSRSRIVDLTEHTVNFKFNDPEATCNIFDDGDEDSCPTRAITLGVYELLKSRMIVLAASGEEKADEIKYLLEAEVDPNFPATYLHKVKEKVLVIVDQAAARQLRVPC